MVFVYLQFKAISLSVLFLRIYHFIIIGLGLYFYKSETTDYFWYRNEMVSLNLSDKYMLVMFMCVIVPIIEEIIVTNNYQSYKRNEFMIPLECFINILGVCLGYKNKIIVFTIMFNLCNKISNYKMFNIKKNYTILILSILFALCHSPTLRKFDIIYSIIVFVPVNLVSQYLAKKYSILSSIMLHIINNIICVIFMEI